MMMDQGQDFVVDCGGRREGMLVRNQANGVAIALCKRAPGGFGIYKVSSQVYAGQPCSLEYNKQQLFRYARVIHKCEPGYARAKVQSIHELSPSLSLVIPPSGEIRHEATKERLADWTYQPSSRMKTIRMQSNATVDVGLVLCLCLISEFVWKDMVLKLGEKGSCDATSSVE